MQSGRCSAELTAQVEGRDDHSSRIEADTLLPNSLPSSAGRTSNSLPVNSILFSFQAKVMDVPSLVMLRCIGLLLGRLQWESSGWLGESKLPVVLVACRGESHGAGKWGQSLTGRLREAGALGPAATKEMNSANYLNDLRNSLPQSNLRWDCSLADTLIQGLETLEQRTHLLCAQTTAYGIYEIMNVYSRKVLRRW